MTESENFTPDLAALLLPISHDAPSGPSMRYSDIYAGIRHAREEEDASLPMGVWERPLKKAEWKEVERLCLELLTLHSKDLQVAAWLTEAWLHRYQLPGFNAGVALLLGLVERYWDSVHPQIEDADDDARAAPFIWINENVSRALLLKVQLLQVPECIPSVVTLAQWEQTLVQERQQSQESESAEQLGLKPLTRDRILSATQGPKLQALLQLHLCIQESETLWSGLTQALDAKMTVNPPSISRVGETIRRIERLANTLIDGRFPSASQPEAVPAEIKQPNELSSVIMEEGPEVQAADQKALLPPVLTTLPTPKASFSSREEAYRQLEVIAAFLQELEPHSPTPYLVRRAVKWGRMPLTELMQAILREEGDVARFFSLLGVED